MKRYVDAFLVALLASAAHAGPPMSTANNAFARDAADAGGGATATANNELIGFVEEGVAFTTAATVNNKIRAGGAEVLFYPGTVVNLTPRSDVSVSSATLSWSSPGYDGGLGTLLSGSTYFISVATYVVPNLPVALASVTISTSGTVPGTGVGAAAAGLLANTTYFVTLWTMDTDANVSTPTAPAALVTLANPPALGALTFLSVQTASVTVAWAALPQAPPAASSQTSEGYVLLASSSNFGALGAGAPTFSSTTFSVLASTLAVGSLASPLNLASTYYFQVGSLNWSGQANYTQLSRLNFQISPSTGLIHLGTIDPTVARSTVSISSMVVVNVGNWPVTLELAASTATLPSSPWTLSTSSAVDVVVLQGVWNNVAPPATAFSTALTTTTLISQSSVNGNYLGNQNGVQIPPGGSATLWFKFWLPIMTSTLGPETMRVAAQPVYP